MRTVPAAAARTGSPVRPSMSRPSWKPYLVRRWPKNWVIGPRNGHAQIGGVSVDTGPGPTGTCKSGPSVMVGVERLLASTAIRAKVRSGMGTGRAGVGAGRGAGSDKRPTIKTRTTTRAAASATRLAVALVEMAMYHSRSGWTGAGSVQDKKLRRVR